MMGFEGTEIENGLEDIARVELLVIGFVDA
jgi:hypothetical protein